MRASSSPNRSLSPSGQRRAVAAVLLVVVLAGGLGVHFMLPDTTDTDIAADALYTVAIYLLVVLFAPRLPPWAVGFIAGAWGVAVELLQLTGLPSALARVIPPIVLVLGTVFDPRDLLVYVSTAGGAALVDALLRALLRAHTGAHRGTRNTRAREHAAPVVHSPASSTGSLCDTGPLWLRCSPASSWASRSRRSRRSASPWP